MSNFVCRKCRKSDCNNCVDILRAIYSDKMICCCTKLNHSGEPLARQIKDPITGDVYTPGAVIHSDGTTEFNENFTHEFLKQLGVEDD